MSLIALYYNKNDNFTVKLSFLISLSLYLAPFRCRRHMKTLVGFVYAARREKINDHLKYEILTCNLKSIQN
jgi:hypothetical protein